MTRVIVIPSDATQPLHWAEYDQSDYKNLTALIFDGNRDGGLYSLSIVGEGDKQISLWYDDEGLFRLDNEDLPDIVNLRTMELWAHLDGVGIADFSVPLIGTYVVTGQADEDGNSMDAPEWVMSFPFVWPNRYVIKKVRGEQ